MWPCFSSTWHKRPPHEQPRHSQSPHYGRCMKKPASLTQQATLRSNSYVKPCVASIVDQSTRNRHSAICSSRKSFHAWCVTAPPPPPPPPPADLQKATISVLCFCGSLEVRVKELLQTRLLGGPLVSFPGRSTITFKSSPTLCSSRRGLAASHPSKDPPSLAN